MDYEKLKETYNKNNTNYELVKRTEKVAMYRQFMPDGTPIGYEVFIIKIQPSFIFPNGKVNDAKEAFPGNEAGGRWLWSFNTLEMANERYEEITNGILRPVVENVANEPIDMTTTKVAGRGRGRGRPRKNGDATPKVAKPAIARMPKQKFVWEGKEYNSRSDVARILLAKDGSNKASVAKKLNITVQTVHAIFKKLK